MPSFDPRLSLAAEVGYGSARAWLNGLVLAGAKPALKDVPLRIGLLPGTFLEKPRHEDGLRPESQRVRLMRRLSDRAEHPAPLVADQAAVGLRTLRGSRHAALLPEGLAIESTACVRLEVPAMLRRSKGKP